MSIFYDLVSESELEDAFKIESQGYPEDEAATLEAFRYRQSQAPELFLGAYLPGSGDEKTVGSRKLIGYVCGTLSPDHTLTHASMSTHVAGADSVCIHSVCVAREHRRKRVGLNLVKAYVARLAATSAASDFPTAPTPPRYARILLIAHEELRGFYERAGFTWVGKSAVTHGARPWFEMRRDLFTDLSTETSSEKEPQAHPPSQTGGPSSSAILSHGPSPPQASSMSSNISSAGDAPTLSPTTGSDSGMPAGLWEALAASTFSRSRPVARLLSSFPRAAEDVVEAHSAGKTNKHDLLCPRPGCGSVILKRGAARWTERTSVLLEPSGTSATTTTAALPEYLGALPHPPANAQWWLVTPNAMAFENIGFSRPVQGLGDASGGVRMKLLACAECDLGPLGWCEEGGSEFWLACNRVGYRV